jgi:RNA polymerase sigma-70 factor, ECF subfamily
MMTFREHSGRSVYSMSVIASEHAAQQEPAGVSASGTASGVRDGLNRLLPRLWRFCLVLSADRSMAEDLVQAACLRALEREGQFQPGTRLDHWVFSIAQTIWLNQRRAEKLRRGGGLVPAEEAGLIDFSAESNLSLAEVFSEIMALPEAQRVAVLLVYVEGYSYKEVAEHLGIPIGTVMSRLASVRGRLSASRGRLPRDGDQTS